MCSVSGPGIEGERNAEIIQQHRRLWEASLLPQLPSSDILQLLFCCSLPIVKTLSGPVGVRDCTSGHPAPHKHRQCHSCIRPSLHFLLELSKNLRQTNFELLGSLVIRRKMISPECPMAMADTSSSQESLIMLTSPCKFGKKHKVVLAHRGCVAAPVTHCL